MPGQSRTRPALVWESPCSLKEQNTKLKTERSSGQQTMQLSFRKTKKSDSKKTLVVGYPPRLSSILRGTCIRPLFHSDHTEDIGGLYDTRDMRTKPMFFLRHAEDATAGCSRCRYRCCWATYLPLTLRLVPVEVLGD